VIKKKKRTLQEIDDILNVCEGILEMGRGLLPWYQRIGIEWSCMKCKLTGSFEKWIIKRKNEP